VKTSENAYRTCKVLNTSFRLNQSPTFLFPFYTSYMSLNNTIEKYIYTKIIVKVKKKKKKKKKKFLKKKKKKKKIYIYIYIIDSLQ